MSKKNFGKPSTMELVKAAAFLAMGFIFLLAGIVMYLKRLYFGIDCTFAKPVFLFGLGEFLLFLAFGLKKSRTFLISMGFMLIFDAVIVVLMNLGAIPMKIKEIWPLFLISAGVSFIPADLFVNKKIRSVFLFPSLILTSFGIFFFMFSSGVIQISFSKIMSEIWPFIFVFAGILLIFIYIFQQFRKKDFPYLDEEQDSDSDFQDGESL